MSSPSLAVQGRCEKRIDSPLVGVGRSVALKRVNLVGGGGNANKRKRRTAQECPSIGFRGGRQRLLLEPSEHKCIDFVANPRARRDWWRCRVRHRLIRPVLCEARRFLGQRACGPRYPRGTFGVRRFSRRD